MPYAVFADFNSYLEDFGTSYYGTRNYVTGSISIDTVAWNTDIQTSFNKINYMLDAVARIPMVPVGTSPKTGSYHPFLIEWNVCDVIYNKLKARHSQEYNNELPQWMKDYGSRGLQIFNDILSHKIVLDTDTSVTGIGYPQRISGGGMATLYSNWDSGFYRASDFPKRFRIRISGTNEGSRIGEAVFQVSYDGGFSYDEDDIRTGTEWVEVRDGLFVRWSPPFGTLVGTQSLLEIGDTWEILCTPANVRQTGFDSRFRTFSRG